MIAKSLYFAAAAEFEAARRVSLLPEGHKARGMHGHSFVAEVRSALPTNWAHFPGGEMDELRAHLAQVVAPLDYSELNRLLEQPTDENLARWIRQRINVPGIESVGVQSTRHQGVDLDRRDHAHVWRRYVFEAAHQLPHVQPGHKCGRMHGHGFEVIVHANTELGSAALSLDYDALDRLWAPLHAELHHACLNDIAGLHNPTSEVIACWIWRRLKPNLPPLSWVTVYETASCGAHFDGRHYRIWKEMTFDSATRLRHAPHGDKRRAIHGHTYTLRLHLHADLDELMGWTVDFGDVKEVFEPIFKRLDHHPLYELSGLADADVASLAEWIRLQAQPLLPQLDRIDLYAMRGCGAVLSWGELGPALPI
ncbi:MAG TPA: 6-carboxytetrahydropterin synthase [Rhodocyclaceae bacterium]|nr:6-carboxytetrahydropterin synthase [Rhodocyclaceae bacterium]